MFKRKRSQRVHPDELVQDAYIQRRYDDLSVCIHGDIKNGRGRYNYYAPWLEIKLQSFPAHYREKHSVLHVQQPVDACQPETPHSHSKMTVFTKPPVLAPVANSSSISPRTVWVEEGEKGVQNVSSVSTDIRINRALPFGDSGSTSKHIEDMNYGNIQREEDTIELADKEHCSAEPMLQRVSFREAVAEKDDRKVSSTKEVSDLEQGDKNQRPDMTNVEQSLSFMRRHDSSTSSKICTIL